MPEPHIRPLYANISPLTFCTTSHFGTLIEPWCTLYKPGNTEIFAVCFRDVRDYETISPIYATDMKQIVTDY
jgi:hypothetical protein